MGTVDVDPGLALGAVFTAAGAYPWSLAVQGVIQVLKMVPQFETLLNGREKLTCFILSLVLVVLAYGAALQTTPPERTLDIVGAVVAFLSWLAVARLSMAAYDDFIAKTAAGKKPTESVLNAKGWNGK